MSNEPHDTLPRVSKIEPHARVGEHEEPAVELWFEPGDRALRYRWSDDVGEILEESYHDGVVHDSYAVGGERSDLAAFALESLAEYMNTYREQPDAAANDWPHIYELLTFDEA
jgi:hypothetical protein